MLPDLRQQFDPSDPEQHSKRALKPLRTQPCSVRRSACILPFWRCRPLCRSAALRPQLGPPLAAPGRGLGSVTFDHCCRAATPLMRVQTTECAFPLRGRRTLTPALLWGLRGGLAHPAATCQATVAAWQLQRCCGIGSGCAGALSLMWPLSLWGGFGMVPYRHTWRLGLSQLPGHKSCCGGLVGRGLLVYGDCSRHVSPAALG